MRRVALLTMGLFVVALGGAVGASEKIAHYTKISLAPAAPEVAPVEELPLAAGRILAVDRERLLFTVEHRGIARYHVDAGKAVLHVDQANLLLGLTPGDKIRFDVNRVGRRYLVTRLENSN